MASSAQCETPVIIGTAVREDVREFASSFYLKWNSAFKDAELRHLSLRCQGDASCQMKVDCRQLSTEEGSPQFDTFTFRVMNPANCVCDHRLGKPTFMPIGNAPARVKAKAKRGAEAAIDTPKPKKPQPPSQTVDKLKAHEAARRKKEQGLDSGDDSDIREATTPPPQQAGPSKLDELDDEEDVLLASVKDIKRAVDFLRKAASTLEKTYG